MTDVDAVPPAGWHVPDALRRAWVAGTAPDEQAWSVEAHLLTCAACRDDVATTVHAADDAVAALVAGVRTRLTDLPEPVRLRPATPARRLLALLGLRQVGLAWTALVAAVLALAVLLDLLADRAPVAVDSGSLGAATWFAGGGTWVSALAPALPAVGVVVAYGSGLDPAREVTASTPFAGLRIVLWRTATVLLTAVPAALALRLAVAAARPSTASAPDLVGWLLPSLGLTLVTLAAGSVLGTATAAGLVCAVWCLGTVLPLAAGAAPPLLADVPPTTWLAVALAGAAVLAVRRDRLGRLLGPSLSALTPGTGGHA